MRRGDDLVPGIWDDMPITRSERRFGRVVLAVGTVALFAASFLPDII